MCRSKSLPGEQNSFYLELNARSYENLFLEMFSLDI